MSPAEAGAPRPEPPSVAAPAWTDPEAIALEPAPPAADALPPAAAPAASDAPVAAAPAASGAPVAAAPAAEARVPALEDLMRLPAASEPKAPDLLASDPPPPPDATPEERAAWRERIRVQRHSAEIGPTGPRQGTYSETDASLRVPVGERVQLEGGVRVNDREEPGRERQESDRSSSSRVGVEVRF